MACRGVHFALDDEDAGKLLAAGDDQSLVEFIQEDIEAKWDKDWLAETDKAWDAIHRCLTDGTLSFEGASPLHRCILGGQQLHRGEDYIVSYLTPAEVKEVAGAIELINEGWMRQRYFAIDAEEYGFVPSEDDFEYTYSCFSGLKDFFRKAAQNSRAVVFTVDQ